MASSIEGRLPMLDKYFTEFALQLPQEYLLDPETLREKKILYEAFEDIVPPHIRTRSKQPFWAPSFQECLTKTVEGKLLINKYISKEAIDRAGVWSHAKIQNLLERLQVEKFDAFMDSVFGVVLSVQILHSLFIENTSRYRTSQKQILGFYKFCLFVQPHPHVENDFVSTLRFILWLCYYIWHCIHLQRRPVKYLPHQVICATAESPIGRDVEGVLSTITAVLFYYPQPDDPPMKEGYCYYIFGKIATVHPTTELPEDIERSVLDFQVDVWSISKLEGKQRPIPPFISVTGSASNKKARSFDLHNMQYFRTSPLPSRKTAGNIATIC
ncbi:hypothetical protein M422DRAFT_269952 [Sphaerobolus stellatus SS14]|uniref:Asparagine synthetase domain-containing protein n=1 Tax=Sphaerobolus stellatus (strain SS14) TaxID=990650 RepID=A0A0C9TH02_SPHS4|nr:hypothetical protein M422DRAFT_269952 [Sphaerobolus stellatus SS14]